MNRFFFLLALIVTSIYFLSWQYSQSEYLLEVKGRIQSKEKDKEGVAIGVKSIWFGNESFDTKFIKTHSNSDGTFVVRILNEEEIVKKFEETFPDIFKALSSPENLKKESSSVSVRMIFQHNRLGRKESTFTVKKEDIKLIQDEKGEAKMLTINLPTFDYSK